MKSNYLFMIPYLIKWEGRLSNDPNDAAASNPCPTPHTDGKRYHTNIGITYTTYRAAVKAGIMPDSDVRFYAMTKSDVEKIFKGLYWDRANCDQYNSQAISNVLAQWVWGSGAAGALNLLRTVYPLAKSWSCAPGIVNDEIKKRGERAVYDILMEAREKKLIALSEPGTRNAKFRKGWLNRHAYFDEFNRKYIK